MQLFAKYILFFWCLLLSAAIVAQNNNLNNSSDTAVTPLNTNDLNDTIPALNTKLALQYVNRAQQKMQRFKNQTEAKTIKTLTKCVRWENKIKRILLKVDPAKAAQLFNEHSLSFEKLLAQYQAGMLTINNKLDYYNEAADNLSTRVKYIQSQKTAFNTTQQQYLQAADSLVENFDNATQRQALISKLIKERQQQLFAIAKDKIKSSKLFTKINKEAYYYGVSIDNYKQLLNDPSKIEATAIALLEKIPAFKSFFKQFSALGRMFPEPDPANNIAALAGLQTRTQITQQIQNLASQMGSGGMQSIQQNIQAAQNQLNQLRDKVLNAGGSNSNMELPNFKPNTQKTKSFRQRLEYGTNLQNQRANSFFPSTSNIGLSLGYKLSDTKIIGIGLSYAMGWGNNWRNIKITSQGLGLRSYVDIKLKKSFWLTGGYEMNFRNEFNRLPQLQNSNNWQQSGLVGLSKVLTLKTKVLKNTKLQLVWDFLSYQQVPRTQAIIYRINYTF
jgi:hypothetical protein